MALLPLPWGGAWRRFGTILLVSVVAVVLYAYIDMSYSLPWNPDRPSLPMFPATPLAKACDGVAPLGAADSAAAIPNLVHYIWLLADPAVLSLDFKVFVSVYSAHLLFRPDKIYFHTDASPELWARTKTSGSDWSRRILNLPNVEPIYIDNPRLTTQGVEIDTFGAKSDFVRAYALRDRGGIYLDVDAVPLRDVAPLRRSGFANVVGGATALAPRHTGYVNTGVWLSRPGSNLATIFAEAMDAFYNGVWAISVGILTDLAYRLHAVPGEVLIMNPRAFAPASFELADMKRLFQPHGDTAPLRNGEDAEDRLLPEELGTTCADALAWLRQRNHAAVDSWDMDFSATYVLHAFDDDAAKVGGGWDGKITLPYVLARRSNYARAVYPAIRHAIKAGVIPVEETT
ncbi:uncharacterized protein PG998_008130 [Apiospora kogelbergensis]|uniref:Glycosyltransferase sugar-binding region containing DXD motif-containing protein n=1 Tax=Apiospora kogelbergensis TaxID=1337665 RepID=A0AAW0QCP4_9PEZI